MKKEKSTDNWEIKDRTYYLTNGLSPLTFTLSSKHTRRFPLLYFDEEKNEIKGDALFFKKTKDTTRFPVGMIVKVDVNKHAFAFSKAELSFLFIIGIYTVQIW